MSRAALGSLWVAVPLIGCDLRARKVNYPEFIARCPPKCSESKQPVYGSGVYASISSICSAAVHSGVVTDTGGKVMVRKVAGRPFYRGNFSNGVHSLSLPRWRESFTVAAGKPKRGVSYPAVLIDTSTLRPSLHTDLKPALHSSVSEAAPSRSTTAPKTSTATAAITDVNTSSVSSSITAPTTASTATPDTRPRSATRTTASAATTPTTTTAIITTATVRTTPTPPVPYRYPVSTNDVPPFDVQEPDDDGMKDWPLPFYLYPDWFTHRGLASGPPFSHQSIPPFSGDPLWPSYLGRLSPASGQHVGRSFPRTSNDMTSNDMTSNDMTSNDMTSNDMTSNDMTSNDMTSNDRTSNDMTSNDRTSNDMPGCMVDVVFLIDGSWSIGGRRFQIQKDFLVEVSQAVGVGGVAGPRVGVVQYGDDAIAEFGLRSHLNTRALRGGIESIEHRGGLSNLGKALAYVNDNYFTDGNGNRGAAPNVAVVLVDGRPTDRVGGAARLAREAGLNVFLLSVEAGLNAGDGGATPNDDFESKVVCRPGDFFSLPVASWFSLRDSALPLARRLCSPGERLACSRTCANAHDLAFLLDGSSSVGGANFATLLRFAANVTRAFEISPGATRVGVVQYTYEQRLEIGLGRHAGREELVDAILGIGYWSGGTSTGAAIRFTTERVFRVAGGNKQKVLVVVTDGRSYDEVLAAALEAQRMGVIIYSVGVSWAIREQLDDMASDPVSEHSYFLDDFDLLYTLVPTIVRNICREFNSKPQN